MVSAVSALGIRPCGLRTHQAVCKVVTPASKGGNSYSLYFQSLAHSCENENSATLVSSIGSALFQKNTGGRYHPFPLPLVFKGLRTLQDFPGPNFRPVRSMLVCSVAIPFLGPFQERGFDRIKCQRSASIYCISLLLASLHRYLLPALLLSFHRYTLLSKEQFTMATATTVMEPTVKVSATKLLINNQ